MIDIDITSGDFDVGIETDRLNLAGVGAIASFTGVVRGGGGLVSMKLEHYPAMTDLAVRSLADTAAARWPLTAVRVVHRVGILVPGDRIVFVGTASAHRAAALESCAYLIDRLKTDAPFWKWQTFADGRSEWVAARETDAAQSARWA